ncbi:MAG: hypothetical protein QG656_1082, partial [Candidatus Hydrogenedentes bacterium]|nr:hypothetical protein [Candidatus Hydrogenedentota bacterium]
MTNLLGSWFIAPAFLGFLGLIPVVVLLYFLKLRRTEVLVPSTMLWIKSLQDLTANAPFQRLRKNQLLLLQILVLLALAIALGRPFVRAEGSPGDNICLLIDRSASMQTVENGATRLDLAKQRAHEILQNLRGGDKVMVVSFADKAEVLCELTTNRFRLRAAIDAITPSDTPTHVRDALLLVHSLVQGSGGPVAPGSKDPPPTGPGIQVMLFSDGNIADLDKLGTRAINLTYVQTGESRDNAGIVALSDRQPAEGGGQRQTFALIHNDAEEPLDATLTLFFNDDVLSVEEVSVPAKSDGEVVVAHGDLGTGVLRAVLDHDDALAVDNTAWLAMRPQAYIKVLMVGKTDSVSAYYLKRALMFDTRVELSAVEPANYADTDEFDLVIFDSFAPAQLPNATCLFLNTLPPVEGIAADGEIENPPILAKDPEHPVMRFLNPATVAIAKAMRVTLPPWAKPLLSTEGGPLIADVSRGGRQVLLITFDLAQTSWPWHLSFPLFIQNLVTWVPRSSLAEDMSVTAGQPLTLMPSPDVERASIARPDGGKDQVDLDPIRPTYYGATQKTGPYTVTLGETSAQYAVNLLDRTESAVAPAASINLGRGEVE